MCAQVFITFDHPQFRNARMRAPHWENTTSTIDTIITQKYKKYTQSLPAWSAIAFDLFSCIVGFCSSQLAVCRSLESQAFKLSPAAALQNEIRRSRLPNCENVTYKMSCYLYK